MHPVSLKIIIGFVAAVCNLGRPSKNVYTLNGKNSYTPQGVVVVAVVVVVAHATVAPAIAVAMVAVVMSNICAITVYIYDSSCWSQSNIIFFEIKSIYTKNFTCVL